MTRTHDDATAEPVFAALDVGRERRASDLHVEPGQGAALRIFTSVERLAGVSIGADEIARFLDLTIDRTAHARLARLGIADAVYQDERAGALRIHATRGKRGTRLAIRLLARSIPELESLRLPDIVNKFADFRPGLYLVCGPTGSGKTTTIASILDRVNATKQAHLILLEDPIEYAHVWHKSIVTQYEIGRDVATFADGVRGALRADPDVLFIGELRSAETVAACLQAAETGHTVFAALHAPTETAHAVHRLIGLFSSDEQDRARARLSESLQAIVGLRLLPLRDGSGLRAAAEVMFASDAIRRLIRDGAVHQLRSTIAASKRDGSQTLESHLTLLVEQGDVDLAVARAVSAHPEEVREPVGHRRR